MKIDGNQNIWVLQGVCPFDCDCNTLTSLDHSKICTKEWDSKVLIIQLTIEGSSLCYERNNGQVCNIAKVRRISAHYNCYQLWRKVGGTCWEHMMGTCQVEEWVGFLGVIEFSYP